MSRRKPRFAEGVSGPPLTSMIDVVFVLLTYFMLSSTFEAPELELAFRLPASAAPGVQLELPDEQIVELSKEGQVILNERRLDHPEDRRFLELESVLSRFREGCLACGVTAAVTLSPDAKAPQQAVVKVLDAARRAGIGQVRFALASPPGFP